MQVNFPSLSDVAPQPVEQLLGEQVAEPRLYSILLGVFAGLALILALLGNYGLLSYIVNRRMHDMAIRMAIGARRSHVMRLVTAEGLRLAIIGAAIGLMAALGLTRLMKSLLFGVTPRDPVTLLGTIAVMLALAVVACYLPARRALECAAVSAQNSAAASHFVLQILNGDPAQGAESPRPETSGNKSRPPLRVQL